MYITIGPSDFVLVIIVYSPISEVNKVLGKKLVYFVKEGVPFIQNVGIILLLFVSLIKNHKLAAT